MCAGAHARPDPVQNPPAPDWYTTALSFAGGPVPCQAGFPAFAFRSDRLQGAIRRLAHRVRSDGPSSNSCLFLNSACPKRLCVP
ncbi:hypothetical protein CBM2637_A70099 [Cupriavidus taiwanensis]|nr:hypothetical protein CBM2637_A70099 [Cupriavidus taiwanensis]SPA48121.1 protein of unknown function [Cupriavidus taiwanensis]